MVEEREMSRKLLVEDETDRILKDDTITDKPPQKFDKGNVVLQ